MAKPTNEATKLKTLQPKQLNVVLGGIIILPAPQNPLIHKT